MLKFRGSTAVLAGLFMLSGCAAGVQPTTTAPSTTPDKSASSTPTVQPTVTPTVEPSAAGPIVDPTCETMLTAPALADIASAGWILHTDLPGGPSALMASMAEQGGLSCYWTSAGGDVPLWYGQIAMDESAWSAQRAQLTAAAYTESDDPISGTMLGARWGDDNPALVNREGVTYYVSQPSYLASVALLQ
ncbi:hypothetical protein E3O42_15950 [Cryobacterium adonitolivorans]|uniref:DUF3558 domain-containing protein n=1 Tax=Cryobacterium adonitolivorans TaxID=1259189 RepID=A0A4R8W309_9MICO|nr:hypothetical protein [Cryobacterium adonitolivorans]TFB97441.1 hypothetical protein E3O42_15950 [Cryobacterium adonitolivorans]